MTELAVGLKRRGIDISVYTSQPNYHHSTTQKQERRTTYKGVPVRRTRAPQVRQTSLPRRLFNWFVFTTATFFGLLFSRPKPNRELVCVSNPPFLSIAVWLVCRIRRCEYTYIVHDLYPDQPVELGYLEEGGVVETIWSTVQEHVYCDAKHVVTNGVVMRDRISENTGGAVTPEEITVIHNWENGDLIRPRRTDDWVREKLDLNDSFVLLYSGNIGLYHDFETVVEAATEFSDGEVAFVIIGDGDSKATVERLAKKRGIYGTKVHFLPFQSPEVFPYSVTSGDAHLVTVREGFEGVNLSIKTYTAMAAGKPVLAIAQPWDDESFLIDNHNIGKHVSQGDVAGVVRAIEEWKMNPALVDQQGKNARRAYEEHYTKTAAIQKYEQLFTHGAAAVENSFPYAN
ncbi:glycosyltransferase family 4 protein [Natrononativus amylolyticus]|uniref:glycosyltransferase family 4 protein n=1 Tax=Natrononativus amylolyticus TaxID=2963434 RepID=UPI0020CB9CEB|nr:glycosyltransferase family 4 protein [Natrononativus amylolyticus]